jgi:hypothetical protein
LLCSQDCFTAVDGTTNFKAPDAVNLNLYSYDVLDGSVQVQLCPNEGGGGDCSAGSAYAVRHPDYTYALFGNDFALIFLPDIPDVNEGVVAGIVPVTLNSNRDVPMDGNELEVFGWGLTGTDQTETSRVPHTIKVNSVPIDQCRKTYGLKKRNTDSMLCTFGDGTKVTWLGDSGTCNFMMTCLIADKR